MRIRGTPVAVRFAVVLAAASGCEDEPVDATPTRVVEEFIARMERVHGDPEKARAAYELLWSEAQANLTERAKRASDVTGRAVAPEEMLAPSRFSLRFRPKRFDSREESRWAVVTAIGDVPTEQRKEIRCVREEDGWRVMLYIPNLPPIQTRPERPE